MAVQQNFAVGWKLGFPLQFLAGNRKREAKSTADLTNNGFEEEEFDANGETTV